VLLHRLWVSGEVYESLRNGHPITMPALHKVKTFSGRKNKKATKPSFGDCVNRLAHFRREDGKRGRQKDGSTG
jgi:hypothetical protein